MRLHAAETKVGSPAFRLLPFARIRPKHAAARRIQRKTALDVRYSATQVDITAPPKQENGKT